MIYSLYLPLGVACLLAMAGPVVSRRLTPAAATRLLSALALLSAVATLGTLTLLAVGGSVKLLPLWGIGADREQLVGGRDGVPWPIGAAALAILAFLAVRTVFAVVHEWRTLRELRDLVAESEDGLMVLVDSRPYAFAVPISAGTVIVSTAMLEILSGPERQALLAHEQAHLTNRHHLYRVIAIIAVAINPLLGTIRREIQLQTERWADERAAEQSSRPVTARSLARAALAATRTPPTVMAYTSDHVRERLAALAIEPPTSRWATVIPVAIAVIIGGAALLDALQACVTVLEVFYP
ncbi:M56 family metallopeptidase [Cryobacterium sp. MDB2-33-2]|uniref:M56 family metallopeptidase n=1 Tax=Cryobacterium sp. MDB2-33-2 TaxID=1259179 RepID=UPI00106BCC76|nr:M56 family metallopeptidase [Cryobacterium sp. MDB2-33-2]TFC03352.1 M56 family peptidase [Cryobacterium sp. MDB2-33-2]